MESTDLARITTILSIALVTLVGLLVLNLFKVHALRKENTELKKQTSKNK